MIKKFVSHDSPGTLGSDQDLMVLLFSFVYGLCLRQDVVNDYASSWSLPFHLSFVGSI